MSKLLFCNKCGYVKTTYNTKPGNDCWICHEGKYIETDVDSKIADTEINEEYKQMHNGEYPSILESDEMLREKYFYGKLDSEISKAAVEKRKYWESPEGVEQRNREMDQWYAKRNSQKFGTGPKCPICGSTNLKKITATRKILKVGLFGRLGTGDLGKTYQCCKCGAKF